MICAVLIKYGEFCFVTRMLISNLYSLGMYDCLEVSLPCAFPSHIVYRKYLPRSSFYRLARFPCRLFLSYGLHVLTSEVHRSLLRRFFLTLRLYLGLSSSPWPRHLYTCIFRQMTRLLLNITRRLAYAAQPVTTLRCISLSCFFSLRLLCCPRHT